MHFLPPTPFAALQLSAYSGARIGAVTYDSRRPAAILSVWPPARSCAVPASAAYSATIDRYRWRRDVIFEPDTILLSSGGQTIVNSLIDSRFIEAHASPESSALTARLG